MLKDLDVGAARQARGRRSTPAGAPVRERRLADLGRRRDPAGRRSSATTRSCWRARRTPRKARRRPSRRWRRSGPTAARRSPTSAWAARRSWPAPSPGSSTTGSSPGRSRRLTDVAKVSEAPLTAVEFGLGGNSVIVGDREGALSAAGSARARARRASCPLVKAHEFEPQGAAILSIGSSTRERSFVTGGADGSLVPPAHDVGADAAALPRRGPARRARARHAAGRRHPGDARRERRPLLARRTRTPSSRWRALLRQGLVRGLPRAASTSGSRPAPPTTSSPS